MSLPTAVAGQGRTPATERDSARASLVRDVTFLASELLSGRATGSAGADSTANYLARRYVAMRIAAGFSAAECDTAGSCRPSYFQMFRPTAALLLSAGIDSLALAYNIGAIVPGADPAVNHEWIVVGAHHDHLGRTGWAARDRRTATQPHLGADDNASGTAAVLELARRIAAAPLRRSVMFVHFGAEEIGLVGSHAFLLASPAPTSDLIAMLNFDMVGRLERGRLELRGLGSSPDWSRLVDSANIVGKLPLSRMHEVGPDGNGSDHAMFIQDSIPAVHLFTGVHSAYHTKDDTVERIDFDGLVLVVEFAERLLRSLGDEPTVPTFSDPTSRRSPATARPTRPSNAPPGSDDSHMRRR